MRAAAHTPHALALRRQALLQECAMQRLMLATEARSLSSPLGGHGVRGLLGQTRKLPLMLAGAAAGLIATRPKQLVKTVLAGTAMWKSATGVMRLARSVMERFRLGPVRTGR